LSASAVLWATVVALGLYHGLNPAMGWPIAVARGLEQRRATAVFGALLPLGGGHFAAMAVVLVPLAWLSWVLAFSRPIRIAAGAVVLLFGLYKLLRPRHPRGLARIHPGQLAWWSFLMATAHGAGLMLVPFMLGLCGEDSMFPGLARSNLATALAVASVHTLAMVLGGLVMAWAVYRYLGLQFLRKAWFNLDAAWAASLVVAGSAGVVMAL
jgi:hypothetical protein